MQSQLFVYHANRFERLHCLFLLGGNGQRQAVNEHIFFRYAMFHSFLHDFFRHVKSRLCRLRNAGFVHGQTDNCRTVFLDDGQNGIQFVLLCIDGIDNRPSAARAQTRFNGRRIR